jgi:purine-binding chemotaxis protein CheW
MGKEFKMNGNGKSKRNSHAQALKQQVTFDWEDIRRRMAAASVALEKSEETAPEVMEQVWARRAERLAQVPVKRDEGEQIQLALLRLGREVYGLDVQYVFDIRPVELRNVTRVPRTPNWVAGVVNLRGRVFSVIDLQRFLGLARENGDAGEATRNLVVVETPDMELALLADQVLPIETVSANQIQEATGAVRGIRPEYLRGIAERSSGEPMMILDLPALLADKQLIIHEEVI